MLDRAANTLKRVNPILVSLALASIMGVALLVLRFLLSWRLTHFYLIWNLFLAWVPLGFASLAWRWRNCRMALLGCAFMWLLFFPNAPYLVTDLVHLRARPPVSFWFDLLLLQLFIGLGLVLGFVSLWRMQVLVASLWGWRRSWPFVAAALALAGFGVYVGRFLRWNSWDVFLRPIDLFTDVFNALQHPVTGKTAILFPMLIAVLLFLSYLVLFGLTRLEWEPPATPDSCRESPTQSAPHNPTSTRLRNH